MKPSTTPAPARVTPAPAPAAAPPTFSRPRLQVAGETARRQSEWLRPGNYILQILSVKEGLTRAPANRPFFVVEAQVSEVEGDATSNRQGTTVSVMVMLDRDGAVRDVRAFLEAVLSDSEIARLDDTSDSGSYYPDGSPVTTSEATYADLVGPSQPLRNRYVQVSAENVKTRKGGDFTKVRWFRPVHHSAAGE